MTQISLGNCPVWLVFAVPSKDSQGSKAFYADSQDPDQTGWMLRLIWVFTGHTGHFAGFVVLQFNCEMRRMLLSDQTFCNMYASLLSYHRHCLPFCLSLSFCLALTFCLFLIFFCSSLSFCLSLTFCLSLSYKHLSLSFCLYLTFFCSSLSSCLSLTFTLSLTFCLSWSFCLYLSFLFVLDFLFVMVFLFLFVLIILFVLDFLFEPRGSSSWITTCCAIPDAILGVCVPFRFDVSGRMCNLITHSWSLPFHQLCRNVWRGKLEKMHHDGWMV